MLLRPLENWGEETNQTSYGRKFYGVGTLSEHESPQKILEQRGRLAWFGFRYFGPKLCTALNNRIVPRNKLATRASSAIKL